MSAVDRSARTNELQQHFPSHAIAGDFLQSFERQRVVRDYQIRFFGDRFGDDIGRDR